MSLIPASFFVCCYRILKNFLCSVCSKLLVFSLLLKQLCISLFLEQNLHSSRKRKIMKMAAIYLFLFAISQFPTGIAQQGYSNSTVSLGSSLSPNNNSYWLSSSRQFAFGFYKIENGFAIGIWFEKIQQKTVIWTANRDDPPLPKDVTLLLTINGVLFSKR
jgi:hypothetical protein